MPLPVASGASADATGRSPPRSALREGPRASPREGTSHEPVGHDGTAAPARTASPRPSLRDVAGAGRLGRLDLKYSPYLYIAPFFIIFGVFGLYPMLRTAWMSLHDWDLIGEPPGHVHRPGQLRPAVSDDVLLERASSTRSASSLLATIPQLLLALLPGQPAQPDLAARADLLPDGHPHAERHLGRRGRRSSSACSSSATSAWSTGCSSFVGVDPIDWRRAPAGAPGSPSPPWSTGGGPATTR